MSASVESISIGVNTAFKNPVLFVPQLVPLVIELLFNFLAYYVFPTEYVIPTMAGPIVHKVPNFTLIIVGGFIAAIVGFITACMIVDMANDALIGARVNMSKSLNLVLGRIGPLVIAAIVAAILSITIILFPVAIFIPVIAIIERLGPSESTKKAFSFVINNLGEVVVFVIIVIVVSIVLAFIPLIGRALIWIADAIFTASAVDLYLKRSKA